MTESTMYFLLQRLCDIEQNISKANEQKLSHFITLDLKVNARNCHVDV